MRGNITRRGKSSWRLKYDVGTAGQRRIAYVTVRGTRKQAEAELAKRLNELAQGRYIARSMETFESYAHHWLTNIAPAKSGPSSLAQYETMMRTHILPQLGPIELQKLDANAIDQFYTLCRKHGLAPVTVGNLHSVLKRILKSAVKAGKLASSPMERIQTEPNARPDEVEVLDEEQLARLLDHLKGHWLYLPTLLVVHTGLRRGEVCGLRWKDLNVSVGELRVAQAIGRVGNKIGVTTLKTKRSRRSLKLPPNLLNELVQHKKERAAFTLKLPGKDEPHLHNAGWEAAPSCRTEPHLRAEGQRGRIAAHQVPRSATLPHFLPAQKRRAGARSVGQGRTCQCERHPEYLRSPNGRRGSARSRAVG
jgi:integrase